MFMQRNVRKVLKRFLFKGMARSIIRGFSLFAGALEPNPRYFDG